MIRLPEGLCAMDKALACHAGGQGSNLDITKDFSAPILLGTHAICTLSHTIPVVTCSSINTWHGGVKREKSWQNSNSVICEVKNRYNSNVWEDGCLKKV